MLYQLNKNQQFFFINIFFLFIFIFVFKKKLKNIKYDDTLAKIIVDNTPIFKHIHPNIITSFSFICNFIILYLFLYQKNDTLLIIVFILRYLSDLLDGQVARTYNKTSKLGNTLDTLSDIMLIGIFLYLFDMKLNIPYKYILTIYSLCIFFCKYKYSIFVQHNNIKDSNKSNIFMSFFVNNSFLIFILTYIFYKN